MRAALYLRASTEEQHQSVDTQETEARRYCDRHGWTVVDVYRDVGASGAEWQTRPQIARLLVDVAAQPRPWDVVVVRDQDRIGRDMGRTVLAIEAILARGARLVEYSTGREATSDPLARAQIALVGVFAEMERANISRRTRDDHLARARKGYVTGGAVYGYDNVRLHDGVVHQVNADEAAMVKWMFEQRAAGQGIRTIAQGLNARGVAPPLAGNRGTASWSPSVVHRILHNRRYCGVIEWGRKRKGYQEGHKIRTLQPVADLVTFERPELRIVDDELWEAARAQDNTAWTATGRPLRRGSPRHLLVGHLRCAACGGPVGVRRSRWGTTTIAVYGCHWHRERGPTVCSVATMRPVDEVDRAVVGMLADVLTPDFVRVVLARLRLRIETLREAPALDAGAELRAELARVDSEGQRLAAAIARGGDLDVLLDELRSRRDRAAVIRAELAHVVVPVTDWTALDWSTLEREAIGRLAALGDMIRAGVVEARAVLARLLPHPLAFRVVQVDGARGGRWSIEGQTAVGMVVSPAGAERNPALAVLAKHTVPVRRVA